MIQDRDLLTSMIAGHVLRDGEPRERLPLRRRGDPHGREVQPEEGRPEKVELPQREGDQEVSASLSAACTHLLLSNLN